MITLRPVTEDDAEPMLALLEPEATKNLQFFSAPVSLERQRTYIRRIREDVNERLYAVEADGNLVGTVGLHEIDSHLRTARLGLLIFRAADRGKGFGRAAIMGILERGFVPFGLNKVYLNVFAENVSSRTMYAKMGFVEEGVLRQEYLLDGKYHDMVRMSMLRSEWETLTT